MPHAKRHDSRRWLTLSTLVLILACAQKPVPAEEAPPRSDSPLRFRRLARFASTAQFDAYFARVRAEYLKRARRARRSGGYGGLGALSDSATTAAPQAAEAPDAGGDDSITNNQESGVDEGDIVKAVGDYFVILRRGRLFSVRQRRAGRAVLQPAGRADAYPPGGSRGTWYDEMLVHGNQIIVIGYSYRVGGTEIGLFRLSRDGRITHRATHFLRSNDYYSSRNYASRLVGDKLIFYMPYYLALHARKPTLPAVRSWDNARRRPGRWRSVLAKVDVYRPLQRTLNPTLHTVVQCDLGRPRLACKARAVIGPYSRTFYVSRDAVYVWVSPGFWGQPAPTRGRSRAMVYRMPLRDDSVTAVRASGTPIDQFSFKQSGRFLNVLVGASGGGDAMWQPERGPSGKLALLRVPLSTFSDLPLALARWRYTPLPRPTQGYALQNRFVGDWLLWGAGAGWFGQAKNGGRLYATHVARPAALRALPLDHGVARIEAMGKNAVVVGSGKQDLFFTSIALGERPAVRHSWVRKNAAQGETRSHGFFFLPTGRDGSGMLGLPVRTRGRPGRHLVHGSAEVVFVRVKPSLRFQPLGALGAEAGGQVNDHCVVSCVDWYGNARPIFFRGRVFALLGYELVEGRLEDGPEGRALDERHRVHFLAPRLASR